MFPGNQIMSIILYNPCLPACKFRILAGGKGRSSPGCSSCTLAIQQISHPGQHAAPAPRPAGIWRIQAARMQNVPVYSMQILPVN